jgi:hypothetical protein
MHIVDIDSPDEAKSFYLAVSLNDKHACICIARRDRERQSGQWPRSVAAYLSGCSRLALQGFWDSSAEEGGGADFRHDLNTTTTPDPKTEIRCSFVSGDSLDTSFSIRRTSPHGLLASFAHVHSSLNRCWLRTHSHCTPTTPC